MKNTNQNTEQKKLTLQAWTKILLKNGTIDMAKYQRMISIINKITA